MGLKWSSSFVGNHLHKEVDEKEEDYSDNESLNSHESAGLNKDGTKKKHIS